MSSKQILARVTQVGAAVLILVTEVLMFQFGNLHLS